MTPNSMGAWLDIAQVGLIFALAGVLIAIAIKKGQTPPGARSHIKLLYGTSGRIWRSTPSLLLAIAVFVLIGASQILPFRSHITGDGRCAIKGNINFSGEHIYHIPGDRYYEETEIDERYGERWFCSEADARAAGWRHAKV
jgi:hypothetical protein